MPSDMSSERLVVIVLLVLAGIVLVPMLLMSVAVPMMGGSWGGGMMNGWTSGSGLWGVWMVGWIVVLLGGGYLLVRGLSSTGRDPALAELRKAYARGDITDEEFDVRREKLKGDD